MNQLERFRRKHEWVVEPTLAAGVAGTGAGFLHHLGIVNKAKEKVNQATPYDKPEDFLHALREGDILFERGKSEGWDLPGIGYKPQGDALMAAAEGTPFAHTALAGLHNKFPSTFEIPGADAGNADLFDLYDILHNHNTDYVAMRPAVSDEAAKASFQRAQDLLKGKEYHEYGDMLGDVGRGLMGVKAPPCGGKEGSILCTDVATSAYPEILNNRYATTAEIMADPKLAPVGRFNNLGALPERTLLASEIAHPLMRGLKWGGVAAGGTALALLLAKMLHNDRKEPKS